MYVICSIGQRLGVSGISRASRISPKWHLWRDVPCLAVSSGALYRIPGVIETEGLTHIHLRVQDIDRSLAFYQQVFGMQEVFRDGDLVFLNTPGSKDTITFNPHDEGLAGKRRNRALRLPPEARGQP